MPFRKRFWPISLDIGTQTVELLQLAEAGNGSVHVVDAAQWAFPESMGDDPDARQRALVEAVREIVKRHGFKGRRTVTCLPADQLQIRNIRLPDMLPEQMEAAIQSEAKERLGFMPEGNQLNTIHAGKVQSGSETRNEIILMAAKPEVIEDHAALIQEMGLEPYYIEAEPVALFRVLERFLRRGGDQETVSVLVDMGVRGTLVVVARGRQIVFTRFIDIGGRRITEAICRELNLTVEQARQMRQRTGASELGRGGDVTATSRDDSSVVWSICDAMRGELEALCNEISLCLRYCSVTFRGLRPDMITLAGGESCDPLMKEMITEQLNVACELNDPFKNISTSKAKVGDRRGPLAEWALCVGMAYRQAGWVGEAPSKNHGNRRLSA